MGRFSMRILNWQRREMVAIILAVILFLSVNILASVWLRSTSLDLTENNLYTLSQGTREVLTSIDEPITVRFFLSGRIPEQDPLYANFSKRVRDLLESFVTISDGKLTLEVFDPEPYSPEEDKALALGLRGVTIGASSEQGYFGLAAINSVDEKKVIPYFDPAREPLLEYDLTKLVFSLTHPKKPVVGLLSSIPMGADPMNSFRPWAIFEQTKQFFEIRSLRGSDAGIDDDVDILLIAHPQNLSERQLYDVDQFILRGGRALICVDPYSETAVARAKAAERQLQGKIPLASKPIPYSTLGKLFDAWGLEFATDTMVGDLSSAQQVKLSGLRSRVVDYLPWLAMSEGTFNRDDVITSQIDTLNLASSGHFTLEEGSSLTLQPLLQSTAKSMIIPTSKMDPQPSPDTLLQEFRSSDTRFILAARLHGFVETAFPGGSPASTAPEDHEAEENSGASGTPVREHLSRSTTPANIIVIGDTDFLADNFWIRVQNFMGQQLGVPFAGNADFVINTLDNLSGSDALISLRSRGLSFRPFLLIEDIRRQAEQRYRERERDLRKNLTEAESKLNELREQSGREGAIMMTRENKMALDTYRGEILGLRKELRKVQHALIKDIDSLDSIFKVLNIWAIPVLIAVFALVLALVQRARYRIRHSARGDVRS
jgi:ABC-type uncharacterized transport system involved in gliding motility auxiliary subunit